MHGLWTDSRTNSGLTWVVEHEDNIVRRYMNVCVYRDDKSAHHHARRAINTHRSQCPQRRPASPPRSSQACSPGTARTPGVPQRACVRRQKRDRHNWALSARLRGYFWPPLTPRWPQQSTRKPTPSAVCCAGNAGDGGGTYRGVSGWLVC
jgi:hypothetical protein